MSSSKLCTECLVGENTWDEICEKPSKIAFFRCGSRIIRPNQSKPHFYKRLLSYL